MHLKPRYSYYRREQLRKEREQAKNWPGLGSKELELEQGVGWREALVPLDDHLERCICCIADALLKHSQMSLPPSAELLRRTQALELKSRFIAELAHMG